MVEKSKERIAQTSSTVSGPNNIRDSRFNMKKGKLRPTDKDSAAVIIQSVFRMLKVKRECMKKLKLVMVF